MLSESVLHVLVLSGILAKCRVMTAVHRSVMIRRRVQGVTVIANVVRQRYRVLPVLRDEVGPQIEDEGEVYGGVALLQPPAALAETVQVDDDDRRELDKIELLRRVTGSLTLRTLPSVHLLSRHEPVHTFLEWTSFIYVLKFL